MTNSQPRAMRTPDRRQASRTTASLVKVAYVAVVKLCRSSRSSMSNTKGPVVPTDARELSSGPGGMAEGASAVGEQMESGVGGAPAAEDV